MCNDFWSGSIGLMIVMVACNSGCTRYDYDIEMNVAPDGTVERKLSVNGAGGHNVPDELLEQISKAYEVRGQESQADFEGRSISGKFQGVLPQDIGGFGQFTTLKNSLGTLVTYRERFRGSFDLREQLKRREQAADRLCELLADWAATTARDDQAAEQVRTFLTGPVKTDLRNLVLLVACIPSGWDKPPEEQQQLFAQEVLMQFLIEHGYADERLPLALANGSNDETDGVRLLVEVLNRKYESDGKPKLSELVPLLQSPEQVMPSLNVYCAKVPEAQDLKPGDVPVAVLRDLLFKAGGNPLTEHDALTLTIRSETKPFATNGEWDAALKELSWSRELNFVEHDPILVVPRISYAQWSFPAAEEQKKCFGRVILQDEPLGDYVRWYGSLNVDERVDWDLFLHSLDPLTDAKIEAKCSEFNFRSVPVSSRSNMDAERIREIFRRAYAPHRE